MLSATSLSGSGWAGDYHIRDSLAILHTSINRLTLYNPSNQHGNQHCCYALASCVK